MPEPPPRDRDPFRRYDAAAELYHRHRPSYPAALIDWIQVTTGTRPPARVTDIGCGTGIATRLLADRGFVVVGIDPSRQMLAFARGAGPAHYVQAHAAATGLDANSVDLVTAAQSFHWFEVGPTLREFRRILRPDGWCAAFWNLRAATPFFDEYDQVLQAHSSEYEIMVKQDAAARVVRETQGVVALREAEFSNSQTFDLDGVLGRAYSSSCVAHGVPDRKAFDREITKVFERHQSDGRVTFQYRTLALCWQLDDRHAPTR